MIRDITNSPRYSNAIESPTSSKNRRFLFEKKTIEDEIVELNQTISNKNNPRQAQSPICYTVYHLYHDGTITRQSGGISYLLRDEFIVKDKLMENDRDFFHFPMWNERLGKSYVVVNECEANIYRAQMRDIYMRSIAL
jgi:hypothetical protein